MGKLILPFATTALRTANTPLEGEILFDSDIPAIYFGDGVTVGGLPFIVDQTALLTDISNLQTDVATNTGNIGTNTSNILTNTGDISNNTANIGINTTQIGINTADILQLQTDLGNIDDTTDISLGTITDSAVPINSSTGSGITTLPFATTTLAGIVTAQDQTFGGRKTFNNDRIIIDAPSATGELHFGWFDDLTPADPNAYGLRRSTGSGYFAFMNNSTSPQLVAGDPNGVNTFFVDATNNGTIGLNLLDTGTGDPGRILIGTGGLEVIGSTAGVIPFIVNTGTGGGVLQRFIVEENGTLNVGETVDYELLVTDDDVLPNKKYVDDLFSTGVTQLNDLSDVDTVIVPPVDGSVLSYVDAASEFRPTSTLLLNTAGCSIKTVDDTGLDWCNEQIGSSGSAFIVLRKSLGTIATPLVLNAGDKIGGWGFVANDNATSNPGYVSLEIAGFSTETQSATEGGGEMRFLVTANGTKTPTTALTIENDGTLNVAGQTDYEQKVTADDDLPNKKYVDDSIIYSSIRIQSVAADQTTNYNSTGLTLVLTLGGTPVNRGTGATDFSYGTGVITCNFTGDVRVSYSIPHTSTGSRASLQAGTFINFTEVGATQHSYIRAATGHNRATLTDSDVFSVTSGDTISIGVRRTIGSNQGAAINLLERTRITIERLT